MGTLNTEHVKHQELSQLPETSEDNQSEERRPGEGTCAQLEPGARFVGTNGKEPALRELLPMNSQCNVQESERPDCKNKTKQNRTEKWAGKVSHGERCFLDDLSLIST